MKNELISIIITTFGRSDTLRRAIVSAINQTYKNIEIIVVDDNEKQELKDQVDIIANSFKDNRIHVVHNTHNLGGALARNEGIKAAKGEYIAFLDDDDEYMPTKVEQQYKLFLDSNDNSLALVYCYCKSIDAKHNEYIYHYDYTGRCYFNAMYDCIAATSQWMCRKNALIDVGMFSNVPCKQDSTLILKLLFKGYSVDRVPEVLSIYHDDGDNRISTASHEKRILGEEALWNLCKQHYSLISKGEQKEVNYSAACRLYRHYKAVGDKKKTLSCLKIMVQHPFKKRTLLTLKEAIKNR